MPRLSIDKQRNITFFIIEIIFVAICTWTYLVSFYAVPQFDTKLNLLEIVTNLMILLGGFVYVFIVHNYSDRAVNQCLDLDKKLQDISKKERKEFICDWFTSEEQRYFKESLSLSLSDMKGFLALLSVLFVIGILHIGYFCINEGCTLWKGILSLFWLSVYLFVLSLWHYWILQWKISKIILNKWELYRKGGKSLLQPKED